MSFLRKVLSVFLIMVLSISVVMPHNVFAQTNYYVGLYHLPSPTTGLSISAKFKPMIIKGLTIYPNNPLRFDFIIDTGDENLSNERFNRDTTKLVKYFLASLTVPEKEMWVNLSPYEENRIIADGLGVTEMGVDLLAQDYLLKQLTASLISPDKELGKKLLERIRRKVEKEFGTIDIPINIFNKVWIVPEKAVVYEKNNSVFVVERRLKVLLEEDYIALNEYRLMNEVEESSISDFSENSLDEDKVLPGLVSSIMKDIIIPEIEKEINEGKNFANLRQIYNSMILATWYKKRLKDGLLGQIYVDKNKTYGVDVKDKKTKDKIYKRYVGSFKKGVYNYIFEKYSPKDQKIVARKYFSGGALGVKEEDLSILTGSNFPEKYGEYFKKDDVDHSVVVDLETVDKASMNEKPKKTVLIFGGTFNPFHNGHKTIAEETKKKLGVDEVIFVPVNISPHKLESNKDLVSGKIRFQWIEKVIQSLGTGETNPYSVSDYEINKEGASFTIDTVRHIREKYSEDFKFYFLIGGDNDKELSTWKDIEELKKLVTFVSYNREGSQEVENKSDKIIQIKGPYAKVSSEDIRLNVAQNKPIEGLVSQEIIDEVVNAKEYTVNNVLNGGNTMSVTTLNNKIVGHDKKFAFVFDIHGVLIQSTWKDEYAFVLKQHTSLSFKEALQWVETNFVEQSRIVARDLTDEEILRIFYNKIFVFNKEITIDQVKKSIANADKEYQKPEYIKAMPGALDRVTKLSEMDAPILLITGASQEVVTQQLKSIGFGALISKKNVTIVGKDAQKVPSTNEQNISNRENSISIFSKEHSGHTIVVFDDWGFDFKIAKQLGGILVGVPESKGLEYEENYKRLVNKEKVDFVVTGENGWRNIADIFEMLNTRRLYDEKHYTNKNVRVAVAQINPTVGDLLGNYEKHLEAIQKAKKSGVDMLLFPELSLTGYPPKDLLLSKQFVKQNKGLIQVLAKEEDSKGITFQVGFVDLDKQGRIYNAMATISDGKIVSIYRKNALPKYAMFNEGRYFTEGDGITLYNFDGNPIKQKTLSLNGVKSCTGICEDAWVEQADSKGEKDRIVSPGLTKEVPVYDLFKSLGANVLYFSNASPFRDGILDKRLDLFKKRAKEGNSWVVYTNAVGGQDHLVFDGYSFIINPQGELVVLGKGFKEDFFIYDMPVKVLKEKKANDTESNTIDLYYNSNKKPVLLTGEHSNTVKIRQVENYSSKEEKENRRLKDIESALILSLKDYIQKNGLEKVIIGFSGGIDSTYVAYLAMKAIGAENVIGISIPTQFNTQTSQSDAKKQADLLGIQFREIAIEKMRQAMLTLYSSAHEIEGFKKNAVLEENIQPRIRSAILLNLSNGMPKSIVLNSSNKSEALVGYFTYGGDSLGGYSPLQDVLKTLIFKLVRFANTNAGKEIILKSIIEAKPSAELSANQYDSDTLPPYEELDLILTALTEEYLSIEETSKKTGFSMEIVKSIVELIKVSEWKRSQERLGPIITASSINENRDVPVTNGYWPSSVENFIRHKLDIEGGIGDNSILVSPLSLEEAYTAFNSNTKNTIKEFDFVISEKDSKQEYFVVAGTELVLEKILNGKFTKEYINELRNLKKYSEDFLQYLSDFKFTGDIDAMQEGRVIPKGFPVMRITATAMEIALLKEFVIETMRFSTIVATNAKRIVEASKGVEVMELGQRRGPKEAIVATRASIIGGVRGTSNVQSAEAYDVHGDVKLVGTMAHLFITSFSPEEEIEAFRSYVKSFPEGSTLLLDTYNTIKATYKAVIVAKEMESRNQKLGGVRLDSGDLLTLSQEVRKILDDNDLQDVKIFVSDDLNADRIKHLIEKGSRIDGFGVGTNLVTGGDIDLTIDIKENSQNRFWRSEIDGQYNKYITTPSYQLAVGNTKEETIIELLQPYWRKGNRTFLSETLGDSRERSLKEWKDLKNKKLVIEEQENPLIIDNNTGLYVIDPQLTFMPGGSLAVTDGDKIVPYILKLMKLFPKARRFIAQDFHPKGHNSIVGSYINLDPMTLLVSTQVVADALLTANPALKIEVVGNWTEKNNPIAQYWDGQKPEIQEPYARFTLIDLQEYINRVTVQVLWPNHAVQGTKEAEFHPDINSEEFAFIIQKGTNPKIDSYSGILDALKNRTPFMEMIKKMGKIGSRIKRLIVVGLAEDYCVGCTAEDASKENFGVVVVGDGTKAVGFPADALTKMHESFEKKGIVLVKTTQEIIDANKNTLIQNTIVSKPLEKSIDHPERTGTEGNTTALREDLYHLTMAQALFTEKRHTKEVTFNYFYRKAPYKENFVIVSGIGELLDKIEKFKFTKENIEYLKSLGLFEEDFLKYLENLNLNLTIDGLREGSVALPNEPILRVQGTFLEVMLIETLILNIMNSNTLELTKEYQKKPSNDARALSGVYKLAVIDKEPRMKISQVTAKSSFPGNTEVVVITDSETNNVKERRVKLSTEPPQENESTLYESIMVKGRRVEQIKEHISFSKYIEEQITLYGDKKTALSESLLSLQENIISEIRNSTSSDSQILLRKDLISRVSLPEEYQNKLNISAKFRSWDTSYEGYNPVPVSSEKIKNKPWADSEDINFVNQQIKEGKRPPMRSNVVDRYYDSQNNMLNPAGRTGITGRGVLGRYGPNLATDSIVIRENKKSGKYEVLLIQRSDTKQFAIPGGMRDVVTNDSKVKLEPSFKTVLRELQEETGVQLTDEEARSGKIVYSGVIDDPRNTDISWVESDVWMFVINSDPTVWAGSDAISAQWVSIDEIILKGENDFYASHKVILDKFLKEFQEKQSLDQDNSAIYGGINFDSAIMTLEIKKDKNGVALPIDQQDIQSIKIDGFIPVIIQVSPINIYTLLGFVDEGNKEEKHHFDKYSVLDPMDNRYGLKTQKDRIHI